MSLAGRTWGNLRHRASLNPTLRSVAVNRLHKPIKLWYYKGSGFSNFGDELSIDIVRHLFGIDCVRTSIRDAELFAVGSVLEGANADRHGKCYVWGSGFISAGEAITNRDLKFLAVRGNLTRKRLPNRFADIPLGDPGLLANLVYPPSDDDTGRIGIIPHYSHETDSVLNPFREDEDRYSLISVKDHPAEVVRKITSCRLILSSSLHGLIVADSFGVPNRQIRLRGELTGGQYKFTDYYSAFGGRTRTFDLEDAHDETRVEDAISSYERVDQLEAIQQDLIESFPFTRRNRETPQFMTEVAR